MSFDIKKYPILALAKSTQALRLLPQDKLSQLCQDLRQYILDIISKTSGHLSSGLGVVELTVALHYVYNTPFDYIIWDVGHQAYPHKILTGRRDQMSSIRKKNGLHPFPCREESDYDVLSVGHASTSISAALGLAISAEREAKNRKIVCVIGDGAITGGMAFEAMNHAGDIKSDILVILNDNAMSISENVGALNQRLDKNFSKKTNIQLHKSGKSGLDNIYKMVEKNEDLKDMMASCTIFEELGFNYTGPIDGHDLYSLVTNLNNMRYLKGPQLLHVITKKGKGYLPAEIDPITWHAVPKFDLTTGLLPSNASKLPSYSKIFGNWLNEMAANDPYLIAITPAMCEGSGMLEFSNNYPKQYFDVAIAEQHAVTFAAGLSIGGYNPIVAIYSTFLQRAYDQVIHDIAIQKLPILFAVDRSGIVGEDGQTHQGVFDLAYLRCIPNMIIMTPSDENECRQMLYTGYHYKKGPSSVRYPRGQGTGVMLQPLHFLSIGKGVIKRCGEKIAILNFGTLLSEASLVANDINATLVDMRFVKPLDEILIIKLCNNHDSFITLEEGVIKGGAGSGVNEFIMAKRLPIFVLNIGLPDQFIFHGTQREIIQEYQLDAEGIKKRIQEWCTS